MRPVKISDLTKNVIIKGTLILTTAGILTRLLGFAYRIFLTRALGSEGIGLFQITTPILSIAFAACVSGIHTGISKFTAERKNSIIPLLCGILIALPLSVIFSLITYNNSHFIAVHFILNEKCDSLIKILSLSIPFSVLHSCITGYYLGLKKTAVPAISQLLEQLVRIGITLLIIDMTPSGQSVSIESALYGNIAGEIGACIYCVISLLFLKKINKPKIKQIINETVKLIKFSYPLTASRLIIHLLQSAENILVPAQLVLFGLSESQALQEYGVMSGMAMPMILFPTALINSYSSMLLPVISNAQAGKDFHTIKKSTENTLKYCISIGTFCCLMYYFYLGDFGAILFSEDSITLYIKILCMICPFMYIAMSFTSILNAMGLTAFTSLLNTSTILIRLTILVLFVPIFGMKIYLLGILFSQIFLAFTQYKKISCMLDIKIHAYSHIIKPLLISFISIGISLILYKLLQQLFNSPVITMLLSMILAGLMFLIIPYLLQKRTYHQD